MRAEDDGVTLMVMSYKNPPQDAISAASLRSPVRSRHDKVTAVNAGQITLAQWRLAAHRRLAAVAVEESQACVDWLLAERLEIPRLRLGEAGGRRLTESEVEHLGRDLARLAQQEPLQYVLGTTPFCGLHLLTDSRALIPRPETEELVTLITRDPSLLNRSPLRIVDVGTGTGCIALALALSFPDAVVTGIDASEAALSLARENGLRLGLHDRIHWRHGDGLTGLSPGTVEVVVSNPPYISSDDYRALPAHIRDYEPQMALESGPSGLEMLVRLCREASALLSPGGMLYCEIGEDQGPQVAASARQFGLDAIEIRKDSSGHDRFLRCSQSNRP